MSDEIAPGTLNKYLQTGTIEKIMTKYLAYTKKQKQVTQRMRLTYPVLSQLVKQKKLLRRIFLRLSSFTLKDKARKFADTKSQAESEVFVFAV